MTQSLEPKPAFLFTTCQVGAENALKSEIARLQPNFRFAFSRPGFLTFKLPADRPLPERFDLQSIFARAYGLSLGKVQHADIQSAAQAVWDLVGDQRFDRLHVWHRDRISPLKREYEPATAVAVDEQKAALLQTAPAHYQNNQQLFSQALPGQKVLDCVLVEPDQWWIGSHVAVTNTGCWTGGVPSLQVPENTVSRAYLKMAEALRWSQLPIEPDDDCVEIGSAPGGASQALLEQGLYVSGIDPALMDATVLAHPKFQHLRMRGSEVRKKEFANTRWLTADINVAPNYTLEMIESIVTHPRVQIQGLLLTLKLLDWKLAADLPQQLRQIRSWGYQEVRARQLGYNRQEVCVLAINRNM